MKTQPDKAQAGYTVVELLLMLFMLACTAGSLVFGYYILMALMKYVGS